MTFRIYERKITKSFHRGECKKYYSLMSVIYPHVEQSKDGYNFLRYENENEIGICFTFQPYLSEENTSFPPWNFFLY